MVSRAPKTSIVGSIPIGERSILSGNERKIIAVFFVVFLLTANQKNEHFANIANKNYCRFANRNEKL